MYSRARGVSGSKKPEKPSIPTWNRLKDKEIETLVAKLAKEGKTAAQIGLLLRDSYGVVSTKLLTGKRIGEILASKELTPEIPDDLRSLIRQSVNISKHMSHNRKDQTAVRGLRIAESKMRRLVKYYKATGKLPLGWKFDAESIKIYAQ
jgi:small subunit ribosomal protein S15